MPTAEGHPSTLVAAHPGNESRLVHGFYSGHPGRSEQACAIAGGPDKPVGPILADEFAALAGVTNRLRRPSQLPFAAR